MGTERVRLAASGPFIDIATTEPLSALLWVDPETTVPVGDQTGSINAPFSTVQAAVNVIVANGDVAAGVFCCPGDYAGLPLTWTGPAGALLVLYGIGAARNFGSINSAVVGTLRLVGLGVPGEPVGAIVLTDTTLEMQDCVGLQINAPSSTLRLFRCSGFGDTIQTTTFFELTECSIDGNAQGGSVTATRTRFGGSLLCSGLVCYDSRFDGGGLLLDPPNAFVEARDSVFGTLTGGEWTAYGCTFNDIAAPEVLTALACRATNDIVVAGAATLDGCTFGNFDALVLEAVGSSFSNLTAPTANLEGCTIGGSLTIATTGRVCDCDPRAGVNAAGATLSIDWSSYQRGLSGGAVTAAALSIADRVSPLGLASQATFEADPAVTVAMPFVLVTEFPAGAAGQEDVTISAALPFDCRFLDCWHDITTSVAGTAIVRTATGGGGTALTSAMSTSAVGTVRSNNNESAAGALLPAGTPLIYRRAAVGVAGSVFVMLTPT